MSYYTVEELAALGVEAAASAKVTRSVAFFGVQRITIGEHCRVDHCSVLTGTVTLGKRVHLAPFCILYGKAGIEIGDYCGFGAFTAMHSESDDYSGRSMFGPCVPPQFKYNHRSPITIGRHVLGGTRVTILPGVRIPDAVSLGAHSLIKDSCESNGIYAGVPAKRIAERSTDFWALVRNFELGMDP